MKHTKITLEEVEALNKALSVGLEPINERLYDILKTCIRMGLGTYLPYSRGKVKMETLNIENFPMVTFDDKDLKLWKDVGSK